MSKTISLPTINIRTAKNGSKYVELPADTEAEVGDTLQYTYQAKKYKSRFNRKDFELVDKMVTFKIAGFGKVYEDEAGNKLKRAYNTANN